MRKRESVEQVRQAALDLLGGVLPEIVRTYEASFGEAPGVADLSALLSTALGTLFDAPARAIVRFPSRGPAPAEAMMPALPAAPSAPEEPSGPTPRTGDVLALELEDGRYGVARILRAANRAYLVEVLDGVFETTPTLEQARSLERLEEWRGRFEGIALVVDVTDDPPSSARIIGRVLPTLAEYREETRILGSWRSVTHPILAKWRWRRDPKALEGEPQ